MNNKLVFATVNSGKLREAQEILGGDFELVTPAQVGITEEVEETGMTLKANSLLKTKQIYDYCGADCFGDDTGLEIDGLTGAPGVNTARYAGPEKDFNKNIDKVLAELERKEREASLAKSMGLKVKPVSRKARFRSVITLILGGKIHYFEGVCEGSIAKQRSGKGGFGYDPIFLTDDFPGKTLADITEEEKNAISHRGKALRAMAAYMATL